jgi:hypothetical protein
MIVRPGILIYVPLKESSHKCWAAPADLAVN